MNCVLVRSIRLLKEVLQNFTPKPLRPISVKKLAGVLEQTFIGQMTGYLAQNPRRGLSIHQYKHIHKYLIYGTVANKKA